MNTAKSAAYGTGRNHCRRFHIAPVAHYTRAKLQTNALSVNAYPTEFGGLDMRYPCRHCAAPCAGRARPGPDQRIGGAGGKWSVAVLDAEAPTLDELPLYAPQLPEARDAREPAPGHHPPHAPARPPRDADRETPLQKSGNCEATSALPAHTLYVHALMSVFIALRDTRDRRHADCHAEHSPSRPAIRGRGFRRHRRGRNPPVDEEHNWLWQVLLRSGDNVSPTFRIPDLLSACVAIVFTRGDAAERIFGFLERIWSCARRPRCADQSRGHSDVSRSKRL